MALVKRHENADIKAGFGFTAGAGYGWRVRQTWSLGVLGRVQYLNVDGPIDRFAGFTPGALFPATYW